MPTPREHPTRVACAQPRRCDDDPIRCDCGGSGVLLMTGPAHPQTNLQRPTPSAPATRTSRPVVEGEKYREPEREAPGTVGVAALRAHHRLRSPFSRAQCMNAPISFRLSRRLVSRTGPRHRPAPVRGLRPLDRPWRCLIGRLSPLPGSGRWDHRPDGPVPTDVWRKERHVHVDGGSDTENLSPGGRSLGAVPDAGPHGLRRWPGKLRARRRFPHYARGGQHRRHGLCCGTVRSGDRRTAVGGRSGSDGSTGVRPRAPLAGPQRTPSRPAYPHLPASPCPCCRSPTVPARRMPGFFRPTG